MLQRMGVSAGWEKLAWITRKSVYNNYSRWTTLQIELFSTDAVHRDPCATEDSYNIMSVVRFRKESKKISGREDLSEQRESDPATDFLPLHGRWGTSMQTSHRGAKTLVSETRIGAGGFDLELNIISPFCSHTEYTAYITNNANSTSAYADVNSELPPSELEVGFQPMRTPDRPNHKSSSRATIAPSPVLRKRILAAGE